MAQPPLFRFSIKTGDLYRRVNGDAVELSAIAYFLKYSPEEWEKTQIVYKSSTDYIGVVRSFSDAYTFVKDGARIARYIKYNEGIDGNATLVIERCNSVTWLYEPYYEGKLSFFSMPDDYTGAKLKVLDGELAALIEANKDTVYQIPVNDIDSIKVLMDGITLQSTRNYLPYDYTYNFNSAATPSNEQAYIIPLVPTTPDSDYPEGADNNPSVVEFNPAGFNVGTSFIDTLGQTYPDFNYSAFISQSDYFKQIQTVQIHETGTAMGLTTFRPELWIVGSDTIIKSQDTLASVSVASGATYTFNINATSPTRTLAQGDRVYYIMHVFNSTGSAGTFEYLGNPDDAIVYHSEIFSTFRSTSSVVKGYRYYQVFQKLISLMTNGKYTGYSSFLSNALMNVYDNRPWWTIITCGDALRGLTDAKLKIKWSDMFKDADGRWMMGCAVENNVWVMEQQGYFFDSTSLIANIGMTKWPTIDTATRFTALTYKNGCQAQDSKTLNGKDEPNGPQERKLPNTTATAVVDAVSPWNWGMYNIEKIRVNLSKKTTTDDDTDNDIFLVEIGDTMDSDGNYPLYRPQNLTTISGLDFPATAFNLTLTGARAARRNGARLRAYCYKQDFQVITFQTGDKNNDLVCDCGSGLIAESADIAVNSLDPLQFVPLTFTMDISHDPLLQEMASNPKGYFQSIAQDDEGQQIDFKWHIDTVGVNPGNKDTYQFIGLAHKDTDTSLFIRG